MSYIVRLTTVPVISDYRLYYRYTQFIFYYIFCEGLKTLISAKSRIAAQYHRYEIIIDITINQ